jgi:hypothetical protein
MPHYTTRLMGLPPPRVAMTAFPVMSTSCTPADIVAFHHAALFSPAIFTLTTTLTKGFIPPLPGLTVALPRKYTPHLTSPHLKATAMGHLDNTIRKK